jgi:hypothetical protein
MQLAIHESITLIYLDYIFHPSTLTKRRMKSPRMCVCLKLSVRPYSFRWIIKNRCIRVLMELSRVVVFFKMWIENNCNIFVLLEFMCS